MAKMLLIVIVAVLACMVAAGSHGGGDHTDAPMSAPSSAHAAITAAAASGSISSAGVMLAVMLIVYLSAFLPSATSSAPTSAPSSAPATSAAAASGCPCAPHAAYAGCRSRSTSSPTCARGRAARWSRASGTRYAWPAKGQRSARGTRLGGRGYSRRGEAVHKPGAKPLTKNAGEGDCEAGRFDS